ncbi:MAG TPA: hypothetical protein PK297_02195 [Spirochaetota bacterium]|nr:hypothetical protein [Spirochaetota bacterium]
MVFRVIDRNGNCLIHTPTEKIARRLITDNLERGYRLVRTVGPSSTGC